MRHELKTWPSYFIPILDGYKTFDIRVNDRDYKVGDVLWLREYSPATKAYSGRSMHVTVTYVTAALGILPHGYNLVVMAIVPSDSTEGPVSDCNGYA